MQIVERMFYIMNMHDLKAIQLAEFLGISANVVSNWKTRLTDPPSKYIHPICEFLNVSVEYFLTGLEHDTFQSNILSHDEQELLHLYNKLSEREQIKLLGRLEVLTEQQESEQESSVTVNKLLA